MGRFIFWTAIFLVISGFLLHFEVKIPWISLWLGKLPGDFVMEKGKTIIFFPITSAAITSLVFTLILSLFSKKEK